MGTIPEDYRLFAWAEELTPESPVETIIDARDAIDHLRRQLRAEYVEGAVACGLPRAADRAAGAYARRRTVYEARSAEEAADLTAHSAFHTEDLCRSTLYGLADRLREATVLDMYLQIVSTLIPHPATTEPVRPLQPGSMLWQSPIAWFRTGRALTSYPSVWLVPCDDLGRKLGVPLDTPHAGADTASVGVPVRAAGGPEAARRAIEAAIGALRTTRQVAEQLTLRITKH